MVHEQRVGCAVCFSAVKGRGPAPGSRARTLHVDTRIGRADMGERDIII